MNLFRQKLEFSDYPCMCEVIVSFVLFDKIQQSMTNRRTDREKGIPIVAIPAR